jgi:cysteine desulfurase family protein
MIYFDNAASGGHKPAEVINAVTEALKNPANPGRGSHKVAMAAAETIYKARQAAAEFFNAVEPENIIFTANCTAALNLAIFGAAQKGHVITTSNEHNSVMRPLFELERRGYIRLSIVAPDERGVVTAENLARHIRMDTYMIVASHISNVTGAVMPILEIGRLCAFKNILFLVDGAQSAGHEPLDMQRDNIDLLAVAPHKGLYSPQGVGILVTSPQVTLSPVIFGGTGTDSENPAQPTVAPDAFESGTLNTPCIAGVYEGISYAKNTFSERREKTANLTQTLIYGLSQIPSVTLYSAYDAYSGVVSFNIKDIPSSEVSDILSNEYNICTRAGLHCAPLIHKHLGTFPNGAVRASLSSQNTEEEVNFFLTAISEIASGGIF